MLKSILLMSLVAVGVLAMLPQFDVPAPTPDPSPRFASVSQSRQPASQRSFPQNPKQNRTVAVSPEASKWSPEEEAEIKKEIRIREMQLHAQERILNAHSYNSRAEAYCHWEVGRPTSLLMGFLNNGMTVEENAAYHRKLLLSESKTREEEQIRQHDLEVTGRVVYLYERNVSECQAGLLNGYGHVPSDDELQENIQQLKDDILDIKTNGPLYRATPMSTPPQNSDPVLIRKLEPAYSQQARDAKISGTVRLSFAIDENGNTSDFQVIHSLGFGLDEQAIEALAKWKFRPALQDGRPVTKRGTADLSFRAF